jgi:hypothetical protein
MYATLVFTGLLSLTGYLLTGLHSYRLRIWVLTLLAFAAMPIAGSYAQATGASVNESHVGTYFYVDAAKGKDSNAGTYGAPFATLGKAISLSAALMKSGVKIFVNPGIYRETITLSSFNNSNPAPLIIEATQPGTAIISGADSWGSGWVAQTGSVTWAHSWPYSWGYAVSPWAGVGALGLRSEVVAVNGKLLTPVLTTPLTAPATYAVKDGSTITIYPPTGTNMKTADIEVGIRSGLFSVPHGIGNLVLRGLTFEYDTTPINGSGKGAVVINSANNVLIDNTKILYNNWVGISLTATNNVTFSYVAADGNGEDGIKGYQVTNWLLNGSETTWNNWRSASGNLFGMDTAGMKVTDVHGLALQNLTSQNNLAAGLWLDTDVANAAISGANLSFNLTSGLMIESCEGPIQVFDTLISYNRSLGLIANAAQQIDISHSTLYGNSVTQIQIAGADVPIAVKDFKTGQNYSLLTSEWTITDDVIAAATSNTSLFSSGLKNSWANFVATLSSNFNDWYEPATSVPMSYLAGSHSLASWRVATGQDASSTAGYVSPSPLQ